MTQRGQPSDEGTGAADGTPGGAPPHVATADDAPPHGNTPVAETSGEDAGAAEESYEHDPDGALVTAAANDPRSREELIGALHEAEIQRAEYLDDVRRARAEFENYRRRMMREGSTQRAAGQADVVGSLLEVLDDLDRTLDAVHASSDEALAHGVELVSGKLRSVLDGHGLERIDAVGVPFDPETHEAVQHREADEPSGDAPQVAEVLRPGYRLGERTLRPAMVVVEG